MNNWFEVENIEHIDSPALLVYPERIAQNIAKVIEIAGGTDKLRPHVKTNKIAEVCQMMLEAGIHKFKCATISEAEMLALIKAPDVLLAYQPVGPKTTRLLKLIKSYPDTHFSCLIDNKENAIHVNTLCRQEDIRLDVFIDLNVGMNRTGIIPEKAPSLAKEINQLNNLRLVGFHGYDGHIHDEDIIQRKQAADISYDMASKVIQKVQTDLSYPLTLVMGGTPTFPIHIRRGDCECSPGTFVFWDWGYSHMLNDLSFQYAALVISRVISIIDSQHICIDLGYKAVAAESPLPRIHFLNAPEAKPTAQSEEHLVLAVENSSQYALGDVLYGVPVHICPTVALYEKVQVVRKQVSETEWRVVARDRRIHN